MTKIYGRVRKQEKRPGREPGDSVGSTPISANAFWICESGFWKVAGYGLPGRIANACSHRECGFESRAFRLCPDGETEIIPRFYREVPGSSPGRGAVNPILPKSARLFANRAD